MLRVAFRVDISSSIGMGHYMRMSVLAEAFTELGCSCSFFTGKDEPVDYSGFNVVVLDTYQINDAYIFSLKNPGRLLVCYDDNALYTYDCDILLNANFHAKELDFQFVGEAPQMLLGAQYALLRREFRDGSLITVKEKSTRIFVCFGGSDLRNFTLTAIRATRDISDVYLHVVLGAYTQCDSEVYEFAADNIKIHKTPSSMYDIMQQCDIAVAAAGSMVYELAAIGLPTIVIPQADNQNMIAKYLESNNLMKWLGNWNSVDEKTLGAEAESLLGNFVRRKSESRLLSQSVNRSGALKSAKSILNHKILLSKYTNEGREY